MKIRIGSIEIIDPTWEEFDALVGRYGGRIEGATNGREEGECDAEHAGRRWNGGAAPADRVVLDKLTAAGNTGVPTQELGDMLGRRGKSIRPGLIEWAVRMGLVKDKNIDPFEDTRIGSRRGARLKPSFQSVARELLK